MSARAQGSFTPVLREVERGLALPIPERVRILRELQFDLEELWERLVASGLPPEEARRAALEALVPDPSSMGELGRLHTPLYQRVTRHIATGRLALVERLALVLAAGLVVLVQTLALLRVDLLGRHSVFLWPVLASGGVLFALLFAKAFQLWVKRDHENPHQWMGSILAMSLATLGIGVGGTVFDLYTLSATLETTPALAVPSVLDWMVSDAALLSVALLVGLTGALAWFVFGLWLTLNVGAQKDLLGGPGPS